MATNPGYEFTIAEKHYDEAQTDAERLLALEEMKKTMPQHKSAEALRANLRTRYKKLQEKIEKAKTTKKRGGTQIFSIKKSEMQAVLVGLTSSGKSSILKALTNAHPQISSHGFTTQIPEVGILNYENCQIQIIDTPAIGNENFDTGIVNTSDTCLIIIQNIKDIQEIEKALLKFKGKRIILFNKSDLLSEAEKRKLEETLKTKKYNFIIFSAKTNENISQLKEKIFKSFSKIRIYTKSPNEKNPDAEPVIMQPNSTVENIAKIIFRGNLSVIRRTRIWGPSSKFSGQEVGLKHVLKDKDVIEFSTR